MNLLVEVPQRSMLFVRPEFNINMRIGRQQVAQVFRAKAGYSIRENIANQNEAWFQEACHDRGGGMSRPKHMLLVLLFT